MSNCLKPPAGWVCTRATGHEGPCAAYSLEELLRDTINEVELSQDYVKVKSNLLILLQALETQQAKVSPDPQQARHLGFIDGLRVAKEICEQQRCDDRSFIGAQACVSTLRKALQEATDSGR